MQLATSFFMAGGVLCSFDMAENSRPRPFILLHYRHDRDSSKLSRAHLRHRQLIAVPNSWLVACRVALGLSHKELYRRNCLTALLRP